MKQYNCNILWPWLRKKSSKLQKVRRLCLFSINNRDSFDFQVFRTKCININPYKCLLIELNCSSLWLPGTYPLATACTTVPANSTLRPPSPNDAIAVPAIAAKQHPTRLMNFKMSQHGLRRRITKNSPSLLITVRTQIMIRTEIPKRPC
jgi:hypothetical protein